MKLLPRKFKIEDVSLSQEDFWYAVWQNIESEKKWAVQLGAYTSGLMTKNGFYNYFGPDTLLFNAPEEAAEYLVRMRGKTPKIS
jgi:hypothetical protein